MEAKILYESLSNLRPRQFSRCCMNAGKKMEDQTICDTLGEVETKELVYQLPYILTAVKSEALVDRVVVTPA